MSIALFVIWSMVCEKSKFIDVMCLCTQMINCKVLKFFSYKVMNLSLSCRKNKREKERKKERKEKVPNKRSQIKTSWKWKFFTSRMEKWKKWSLWHKKWRQKEEFFKSTHEPQKLWNKQGKWVYNDSEMMEMISNIRNMSPINTSYKI